ncbi:kinase-like domain-containing protein, partial [Suillus lakei]
QSNVLIYGNGRACIADFGLSKFLMELQETLLFSTSSVKGSARWAAPEMLLMQEEDHVSPHHSSMRSDIYSFGIMLQVCTSSPTIPGIYLFNPAFQVLSGQIP